MYATSNRASQLSVQAVLSMLVIGTLAVIIGIVFSFFISRLISRPVTELKEAALQIAEGNYEVQVPAQSSIGNGSPGRAVQSNGAEVEKIPGNEHRTDHCGKTEERSHYSKCR